METAQQLYARLQINPLLHGEERFRLVDQLWKQCCLELQSDSFEPELQLLASKVAIEERGDLVLGESLANAAVQAEPSRPQFLYDLARVRQFQGNYAGGWDALRGQVEKWWSIEQPGLYDVGLLLQGIICGMLIADQQYFDLWMSLVIAFTRLDRAVANAVAERLPITFNFARTIALIAVASPPSSLRPTLSKAQFVILGDSHILPVAWSQLASGEILVPLLTIGLKAFHFTEAGRVASARERSILDAHLAMLPASASTCIISCGEIDCRPDHGIHLALHRGHYPSLEAACDHLADAVVSRLESEKWAGRFLLHPVRPPLRLPWAINSEAEPPYDARTYISALNSAYKSRCSGSARVAFLDFTSHLQSSSGFLADYFQRPGDQVHMNENYIDFLSAAVSDSL